MPYLILIIFMASLAFGQFSNPPSTSSQLVTWNIGQNQEIKFTVDFSTLSVALWQQAPQGGTANLGPIIFQSTNSKTEFGWQVQTYDFSLDVSNKFYFWVFEGDSSQQGNLSVKSQSSPYFYIVDGSASSSSSTGTPTTTSTSTPTTPSNSQTTQTASQSAADVIPGENGQTVDTQEKSGGLSVGAKAGIGISASFVGIAVILGAGFCFRRLKRHQQQIEDLQRRHQQSLLTERAQQAHNHPVSLMTDKPGPFELSS
ncbi:hypothetical protein F5B19DRAFT_493904 [Rostrohypoxylon terebratum]|nr:hypothetical protein F5B19DRAFT_493904 [Rostrohypoxylon terebratum]